jgi:hypothetical protein
MLKSGTVLYSYLTNKLLDRFSHIKKVESVADNGLAVLAGAKIHCAKSRF